MAQSSNSELENSFSKNAQLEKSHDILTCTIKAPPFSYAHLELVTEDSTQAINLDELQVKSYCTAALRQFMGLTGAGMPLDILKAQGNQCWVRVERPDLGSFAAAITAWRGTNEDGVHYLLRLVQCSDWLGTMVGSDGQDRLWNS
jgi:ribonuclease P/MRP protein subunit POP8